MLHTTPGTTWYRGVRKWRTSSVGRVGLGITGGKAGRKALGCPQSSVERRFYTAAYGCCKVFSLARRKQKYEGVVVCSRVEFGGL
ncbi:hypothetical protein Cenrod_1826 [Candidatus Symbiobacter mobilis CR]|uniref:Uncharacterized protein n=1 Tax=Candidatus Symbiobacter mobilis CR TaxID=946483 RepID=U5N9C7_9BURK|nr:hypothetical protein Cenrod_1826 [Candidatus Symbiobacter mobilis CR]